MNILEILESMDADNDAVWTQDGLPQVGYVSQLHGTTWTRAEITSAAPNFTRDSGNLTVASQGDGDHDSVDGKSENENRLEELQELIATGREELNTIQSLVRKYQAELDVLITERSQSENGVTLAENVSRFQKSQADQRVATIRRKQKLEAALDLMEQDET